MPTSLVQNHGTDAALVPHHPALIGRGVRLLSKATAAHYTANRGLLYSDAHHAARWALEEVDGIHETHGPSPVIEDQGVSASAAAEVLNALEELAVGDAGRHEDQVVAGGEVLGIVHLLEVDPHVFGPFGFLLVA